MNKICSDSSSNANEKATRKFCLGVRFFFGGGGVQYENGFLFSHKMDSSPPTQWKIRKRIICHDNVYVLQHLVVGKMRGATNALRLIFWHRWFAAGFLPHFSNAIQMRLEIAHVTNYWRFHGCAITVNSNLLEFQCTLSLIFCSRVTKSLLGSDECWHQLKLTVTVIYPI